MLKSIALCALACPVLAQPIEGDLRYWPPAEREAYLAHENALLAIPNPEKLRAWHDLMSSEPHIAGTDGDWNLINNMARSFEEMGLEVEIHEFWPLLADPIAAEVEIVSPTTMSLPIREKALEEDEYSDHPELLFAFNAYSGSGEAIGEVVYANHGRKEDFKKLKELGVDCTDKIVIARYGGNYRGYKAKFAEQAGAAALLIYTDPANSGFGQGLEYPEGGYNNEHHVQRGSIKTLPYQGDPLTPFVEATEDAQRLDADAIDLPRIPVQPIGYGAANEILKRMTGREIEDNAWQGGLALRYRLEGGEDLHVRVKVEQPRSIKKTANVIGRLEGSEYPDQVIIVGGHHDAWGFGASDPQAGTICTMEAARAFAKLAAEGHRPKRTILFCGWGAEEWGIIGSTEWVEANADWLSEQAIAYINLDGSATGPNFGAGASPSLKRVIVEASRNVPQAGEPEKTVYESWLARGEDPLYPGEPRIGDLGGGSDHVGFWCHLCIPSTGLNASGSKGSAYHGNYDTLAWYRQVVGDDYESALMVSRMTIAVASRLANATVLPLEAKRYGPEFRKHLRGLSKVAIERGVSEPSVEDPELASAFIVLDAQARRLEESLRRGRLAMELDWSRDLDAKMRSELSFRQRFVLRNLSLGERALGFESEGGQRGLPGRPWFRNIFAAPDPNSGYGAWMLPGLRQVVETGDGEELSRWIRDHERRIQELLFLLGE